MTIERKEMIQEQFEQLMNDESFCNGLAKVETAEAVSGLLGDYGIELSAEEVMEITREGLENIKAYGEKHGDELGEDELDAVVGGGKFWRMLGAIGGAVVVGGTLGLLSGACPAFAPAAYKIGASYAVGSALWVAAG